MLPKIERNKSRTLSLLIQRYTNRSIKGSSSIEARKHKRRQIQHIGESQFDKIDTSRKIIYEKQEQHQKPQLYAQLIKQILQKRNAYKKSLGKDLTIIKILSEINPFFAKIGQLTSKCLLQIGNILVLEKDQQLYQSQRQCKYFYIVICGKLLIKTNMFLNYVIGGEVLCEQKIFQSKYTYRQRVQNNIEDKMHENTAKACLKSCLLRIKLKKFCSLQKQFNEFGLKRQFIHLQNILKTHYFHKKIVKKNFEKQATRRKSKRLNTFF